MNRRHRRGATTIEMTFVGIPIIFTLISIFEISRGMWMYHTAAHAVREGVRFAIVHGNNCAPSAGLGNNCQKSIAQVARVIRDAGIGLDPDRTSVTFTAPFPGGGTTTCTLTNCASDTATMWPPSGSNNPGTFIRIDIRTPFNSALAMFWPGAGAVSFATANLGATSIDAVQF